MTRTLARRLSAVLAVAALTGLLAACTGGSPAPQRTAIATVRIDSPALPDALQQPGTEVVSSSALGPQGGKPALLVASLQQPGAAPALSLWTTTDGQTWTRGDFRQRTAAAVTDVFDVASDEYTVIGGTSWADGAIRPVLYGSADRASWSPIPLPTGIGRGDRIAAAAVVGSRVAVVATDARGRATGAVRSGGTWSSMRLPAVATGSILNPLGLAATGQQLILLARPGKDGASSPIVAYRSIDGGRRWSAGSPVADKSASVTGIVAAGSQFVVTGSMPPAGSVVERPMAWSSADGETWAATALSAPAERPSSWADIADVQLDAATVGADGTVSAVMSNDNAAISTVWTRGSDGSWSERGQTGVNSASGETGSAFTLGDGRVAVILGSGTWLRAGVFAGGWVEGTVFAARAPSFAPTSATTVGSRVIVPIGRSVFSVGSDLRWTNSTESKAATLSSTGEVAGADGVPGEAAGLRGTVYGASGSSAVVLGWTWPGVGPIVTSGFATTDGTSWTPVGGFPGDGSTIPDAVVKAGSTWIAATARRSSTNVGTVSHAALFTSTDGVTWAAAAGDFGSGQLETRIADLCVGPDGSAVAVGWAQRSANEYGPAVWRAQGGTWSRSDLGALGDADGYFEHCASGSSRVTATATVGGRSTVLTSDAKGVWTTRFTAQRGDEIGKPEKVSGGYAASGSHGAGRESQAVVWLSATGRSWTPVTVPSLRSGATTAVTALGKDLVVTMSPEVGHPIVVVRGIASVISARAT